MVLFRDGLQIEPRFAQIQSLLERMGGWNRRHHFVDVNQRYGDGKVDYRRPEGHRPWAEAERIEELHGDFAIEK